MTPTQLVNARDNALTYLEACEQAAKYAANPAERDTSHLMKLHHTTNTADMLIITPDIFTLAINTLTTTGILEEWFDLLPTQLMVSLPEPIMEVRPNADTMPTNHQAQAENDDAGLLAKTQPLARPCSTFIVTQTGVNGIMGIPVMPMPELGKRATRAVADISMSKMVVQRHLKQTQPYKPIDDCIKYYQAFTSLDMGAVPVVHGVTVPTLPTGMTLKAMRQCAKTAAWQSPQYAFLICLLAACYALARQPQVAETRTVQTPVQNTKKQATNTQTRVSVITLRKTQPNPRTGRKNKPHSYRYIVSGHFRNQPYGEGRKDRKRIWIAPYIAGPPDKPLIIKDKVHVI